ncbi:DUF2065 domain-containing protein [Thermotomaculum hydrothermale]
MVLGFTILIEGCMPFFTPKLYKKFTAEISQADEKILRILGFVAIIIGLLILYYAKGRL